MTPPEETIPPKRGRKLTPERPPIKIAEPNKDKKVKKKIGDDDEEDQQERSGPRSSWENPGPLQPPILPASDHSSASLPPLEPVHSDDDEDEDEGSPSNPSHDSQGTIFYPENEDLFVSDFHQCWSTSSEAHRIAAATQSFSVPRDVNNQPFDLDSLSTQPSVLACFHGTKPQDRVSGHESMTECYNITDSEVHELEQAMRTAGRPNTKNRARKEASIADLRKYREKFDQAKRDEIKSWLDNDVFDLVDSRKMHCRNYVTGRWVLTIKTDQNGNFLKCKARWVLRGFQDKQKNDQQTDSPAATRPGFRLACQFGTNRGLSLFHMDLKTAFLQGEAYDETRDVVCQLPAEAGHPPYIVARLKKPAYGMNDAPRRWWNIVDSALQSYGLVPTPMQVQGLTSRRPISIYPSRLNR